MQAPGIPEMQCGMAGGLGMIIDEGVKGVRGMVPEPSAHLVTYRVAVVSLSAHGRAHTQAPDPQADRTAHASPALNISLACLPWKHHQWTVEQEHRQWRWQEKLFCHCFLRVCQEPRAPELMRCDRLARRPLSLVFIAEPHLNLH